MDDADGARLHAYLTAKWGRQNGGMLGLADAAGLKRGTLYGWFSGKSQPDLRSLGALANALKVTRAEIVAALDGQVAPPDWRQEFREEMRGVIRETLAEVRAEPPQRRSAPPSAPAAGSAASPPDPQN